MYYYRILDDDGSLITILKTSKKMENIHYDEIDKEMYNWLFEHGGWFVPMVETN